MVDETNVFSAPEDTATDNGVETTELTATIKSRIDTLTDAGIVGQTIEELRANFGSILNISPNATASVNNNSVDEDYVVEAGDVVTFALALGEKG